MCGDGYVEIVGLFLDGIGRGWVLVGMGFEDEGILFLYLDSVDYPKAALAHCSLTDKTT